jgi:hypothetical protein
MRLFDLELRRKDGSNSSFHSNISAKTTGGNLNEDVARYAFHSQMPPYNYTALALVGRFSITP